MGSLAYSAAYSGTTAAFENDSQQTRPEPQEELLMAYRRAAQCHQREDYDGFAAAILWIRSTKKRCSDVMQHHVAEICDAEASQNPDNTLDYEYVRHRVNNR